ATRPKTSSATITHHVLRIGCPPFANGSDMIAHGHAATPAMSSTVNYLSVAPREGYPFLGYGPTPFPGQRRAINSPIRPSTITFLWRGVRTAGASRSGVMDAAIRKADVLIEALSYIRTFRDRLTVIKLGGSVMEDPDSLRALLQDVVFMETVGMRPILVHGG